MIILEANYSKKLGLPQYSSHQYSVSVRTEVSDLTQVESASSQLYRQLQDAVDRDIQEAGFLPGESPKTSKIVRFEPSNPNWNCSQKQRQLVEKLMSEHRLSIDDVNTITRSRFGCEIPQLGKMQCSELIDFMIDHYRKPSNGYRGGPS